MLLRTSSYAEAKRQSRLTYAIQSVRESRHALGCAAVSRMAVTCVTHMHCGLLAVNNRGASSGSPQLPRPMPWLRPSTISPALPVFHSRTREKRATRFQPRPGEKIGRPTGHSCLGCYIPPKPTEPVSVNRRTMRSPLAPSINPLTQTFLFPYLASGSPTFGRSLLQIRIVKI